MADREYTRPRGSRSREVVLTYLKQRTTTYSYRLLGLRSIEYSRSTNVLLALIYRYEFHRKRAATTLSPKATVSDTKRMNFSLCSLM